MSELILNNLDQAFDDIKNNKIMHRYTNGGGIRSSIVDPNTLPQPIRRRMRKQAAPVFNSLNAMNVKLGNPTFYHPLFQTVNMMLPRDRRERNEWCRHFYRTEPIIATAIDLHTEYPISGFNNQCSDSSIKKFFDYLAFDKLDIISLLLCIGHEYWKLGDVFPMGQMNEAEGIWEKFTILNPDYISIKSSVFAGEPIIELIPDSTITTIVNEGPAGKNAELYRQLPPEVIRAVHAHKYIKLDSRMITHIAHKSSDYEIWGTPLMMRCFKTLIYKDKLRNAQDAIANRHIFPIRLARIGTPGEPYPSQGEIDSFRDTLMMADEDPTAFIVYHYGVTLDYVGSSGKILPLNTEFDFIQKELMNGLGINEALLNGQGPTYANAQVGMDALAQRYMSYRFKLESWIRNKIYKPIAEIQGFYKSQNGEVSTAFMSEKEMRRLASQKRMDLIIPSIRWQQQDLTSNQSAIQLLNQLQQKNLIPTSTVFNILGLDPEVEKKTLERERGTVLDPNAPKTGDLSGNDGPPAEMAPDEAAVNNKMVKTATVHKTYKTKPVIIEKKVNK